MTQPGRGLSPSQASRKVTAGGVLCAWCAFQPPEPTSPCVCVTTCGEAHCEPTSGRVQSWDYPAAWSKCGACAAGDCQRCLNVYDDAIPCDCNHPDQSGRVSSCSLDEDCTLHDGHTGNCSFPLVSGRVSS